MQGVIQQIEAKYQKKATADIRSGDTVRVHQKVVEGGKERTQVFEGLVIRVSRRRSLMNRITVRRVASGVGVEKTYPLHSPSVLKVEVTKRSKVRRNYLSYMRGLSGKSARLTGIDFDRAAVNAVQDEAAAAEEERIHKEKLEAYDPAAAKEEKAKEKAESQAAEAAETAKSEAEKIEEKSKERPAAKAPAEEQNKQKN